MTGPITKFELGNVQVVGPGGAPTRAKTLDESRITDSLFKVLRKTELCSLATVTPNGIAHSAHVYFAFSQDLEICFLSDPDSLHCRNLTTNASMAVSVYDSTQKWGNETGDVGVALYGSCKELSGKAAKKTEEVYARRFKEYIRWRRSSEYSKGEGRKWKFFSFVPSKIKLFDEQKFGSGVFVVATIKR